MNFENNYLQDSIFETMRTKLLPLLLAIPFIAFSQKEKKGLPLKAERFFELSTTSGTWMSVDIHPSGEKLVFDLLGDLYELPLNGGKNGFVYDGESLDQLYPTFKKQEYPWTQKAPSVDLPGLK